MPRKEGTKSIYRARQKINCYRLFSLLHFSPHFPCSLGGVGEDEEKANVIVLNVSF